jgi:hypothetical protein
MQVSVENVGNLGRKLTVRIPAARLEDTVRNRVQEMGRSARLKGFRPGKVPTKVIEQRFGAQIRGEALSELIGSSFQEAINTEKLRPAMQPAIATSGKPDNGEIEYTATFEVMPEIGKVDVSALEILKQTATVEETDIDAMIETLRMQRRVWNPVDRKAEAGDMVFEFSAQATVSATRRRTDRVARSSIGCLVQGSGRPLLGMSSMTSSRRIWISPMISASKGLPASRHVPVSRSSAFRKPSCRNWMTPFLPRSA